MNNKITRKFEFDAGHRVLGHESKCANLHGHRYVAEVTVEDVSLDTIGRVIDFAVIKKEIGEWIDDNWDHNILLNMDDPLTTLYHFPELKISHTQNVRAKDVFGKKNPYVMPPSFPNPTVENMVAVLFQVSFQLMMKHGIKVTHVRLYETPNCWADYDAK